jgi:hypothetical protein
VVNSIVRHVQAAGGRFLEMTKYFNDGELWLPVSEAVAREKVSHALRDKLPLDSKGSVFCRLKAGISNLSLEYGTKDDYTYDLITSLVLSTDLPRMEHASDKLVEGILFQELKKLLNSHAAMLRKYNRNPEHAMHKKSVSTSNSSKCAWIQDPCDMIPIDDIMAITDYSEGSNHDLSANNLYQSTSIASVVYSIVPCKSLIIGNDEELCKIQNYFFDYPISCDEQELKDETIYRFSDLETPRWDLPENFSEKDCEDLIASLDHHSSIY